MPAALCTPASEAADQSHQVGSLFQGHSPTARQHMWDQVASTEHWLEPTGLQVDGTKAKKFSSRNLEPKNPTGFGK